MSDFIPSELMPQIPPELIPQILKRVPSKSLIRFRCVSKSWNSLISSSYFVAMHTQHAFQSETHVPRILVRRFSKAQKAEIYSFHYDTEAFTVDEDVKIVIPFRGRGDMYFRVVGCSNGVVFLSDDMLGYRERFVLLNPLLRRKITLPDSRAIFHNVGPYESMVGFGYDAKNNDFKVVKLTYLQGGYEVLYADLLPPIVEVFSLSTKNWREINGNSIRSYVRGYRFQHAFLHGKVHWIAYHEGGGMWIRSLILVFDISDEVFVEMPLPDALVDENPMHIGIAVYEESLVVFHHGCIWVMEEYGVGKSWTKMFNIHVGGASKKNVSGHIGVSKNVLHHRVSDKILGFRKNGSLLLAISKEQLVSYDPTTQDISELGVFGSSEEPVRDLAAVTYTESLALQNEGEQALAALPNETEDLFVEPKESDLSDAEWGGREQLR